MEWWRAEKLGLVNINDHFEERKLAHKYLKTQRLETSL